MAYVTAQAEVMAEALWLWSDPHLSSVCKNLGKNAEDSEQNWTVASRSVSYWIFGC